VIQIGSQAGTYVYHAHTNFDLIWAFGSLIIDDSDIISMNKNYYYDEERVVMLSQCWHVSISDLYKDIMGSRFFDIPEPSSILINGCTYGSSGAAADAKCNGYEVINVEPNKVYRFRVIGIGDDSMLKFSVANHSLTIIEVDGSLVDPVVTDHLEINPGQRYSVLVKTNQNPHNYIIKSEMIPGPGPDNGIAILHYKGAQDPTPMRKTRRIGSTKKLDLTKWVRPQIHPSTLVHQNLVYKVPTHYNRELIIKSLQKETNGSIKFTVNDVLFQNPEVNLLKQIRSGVNITNHPGVYEIRKDEIVQIVFQNQFGSMGGNSSMGMCEQHPWHMHGHTFYIVGEGPDEYDPIKAKAIIDDNIAQNTTQFRDVLTLYANRSDNRSDIGTPCGWTAIRFIANNPGAWIVHCHFIAHAIMGKMFVLYEH